MPFNEKGEIIRPKNREKTRSDIQRSVPSNDGDTSVSDTQRSDSSNDDDIPTSTIFYFSGYLFSFVISLFFLVSIDLDPNLSLGMELLGLLGLVGIISFFWPFSVPFLPLIYLDFFDIFNVFYWSGYLLSLFLFMWQHYCCEKGWFGEDNVRSGGFVDFVVVFVCVGILSLLFWPFILLMSAISLLIHYFRSFMKEVAAFTFGVILWGVIAFISIALIDEFA